MGYVRERMIKQHNAAAVRLGRLGGLSKSKAKADAARKNGRMGGRPKNQPKRKDEDEG